MTRLPRWPRAVAIAALATALLAGTGCSILVRLVESNNVDAVDGGSGIAADASGIAADAGGIAADARSGDAASCTAWTYTPAHIDPCAIPSPNGDLVLGPGLWTYDTNSGALTDPQLDASFPVSALVKQSGGPELRVISVRSVDIAAGATLRATGKRPLVIVSWSTMTVSGVIDVGSTATSAGAGADPAACPDVALQTGADSPNGAGGGGGGGFASAGGKGGPGENGATAAGAAGAAVSLPATLRGGCPGGPGGNALAGPAGHGGGALYLVARDKVVVDGVLEAGGGGGGGSGGDRSGGSGGGSGGMIDLQSDTVRVTSSAIIASNGGGGGGGSDANIAMAGADGLAKAAAAPGGNGEGMGAAGGDGGFAQTKAQPGLMAGRGGGGGGGGTGFNVVRASTFHDGGAVASPSLMTP